MRGLPSLVKGGGLKIHSRRGSGVQIPAPAPLQTFAPRSLIKVRSFFLKANFWVIFYPNGCFKCENFLNLLLELGFNFWIDALRVLRRVNPCQRLFKRVLLGKRVLSVKIPVLCVLWRELRAFGVASPKSLLACAKFVTGGAAGI